MSTTLVVLLPLLLVPIVLLLAFAGCEPFGTGTDPAPEPEPDPTTKPKPTPTPAGPVYGTVVRQTNGLVAHWRLDESGGTALLDSGPDSATGKFNGTYHPPGVTVGAAGALSARDTPNRCAEFDGSTGYAEVAFDPRLNPLPQLAFSVEAWVRPAPDGPDTQTLVSSRQFVNGGWQGYELVLVATGAPGGAVTGRVYAGGTGPRNEVVVEPEDGDGDPRAWRHVVLVYDNGKLDLTVRIVGGPAPLVAPTSTQPLYRAVTAGTLRLGAGHQNSPNPENFLAGRLDEVAFYNVPLAAAQIAAHFNAAT